MRTWLLAAAYVVVVGALAVRQAVEPSGAVLAALVLTTLPWSLVAFVVLVQAYYALPVETPAWLAGTVVVAVWVGAAVAQLALVRRLARRWASRPGKD